MTSSATHFRLFAAFFSVAVLAVLLQHKLHAGPDIDNQQHINPLPTTDDVAPAFLHPDTFPSRTAPPQDPEYIVDPNGNRYQVARLKDGQRWMLNTLKSDVANSWCYADSSAYCADNGRLYTFKSAVAACKQLGKGWHLPSIDEFQHLIKSYNDTLITEDVYLSLSIYKSLFDQQTLPIQFTFSGTRYCNEKGLSVKYSEMGINGAYWLDDSHQNDKVGATFGFKSGQQRVRFYSEEPKWFGHTVICSCDE